MERREGKMVRMSDLIERNIILRGADVITARGFTQVPNHALENNKISPGAKLTFAMLLKYAWQNGFCFPGQDRLATDMGVSRQSANTYLQELQSEEFILIKRRGQGKTNIYELNCKMRPKRADRTTRS